jgi:F420-non-reducing hydrogenase large subunit
MLEDHALHLYVLGGPDLFVGPEHPRETRNAIGVFEALGPEISHRLLSVRGRLRAMITRVGGRAAQPVLGLPGGVAKPIAPGDVPEFQQVAHDAVDFALSTLQLLEERVLASEEFQAAMRSETYTHRTHYLGMVDAKNRVQFYDGVLRAVNPDGREIARFPGEAYEAWIREHVEPWSYAKFCYLRPIGWKGFVDGPESGIYAVGPLARLNVADGMATPQAQRAYERYCAALGPKPIHATLATHWARAIEMLYAAERLYEILQEPALTGAEVRTLPTSAPSSGIGVVEAPRGILIHDYSTDDDGLIREANLIVGTQHNAARIALSVEKAAKQFIHRGAIREGLLNRIEMAFRAYDPCNACASHALPEETTFAVTIRRGRSAHALRR